MKKASVRKELNYALIFQHSVQRITLKLAFKNLQSVIKSRHIAKLVGVLKSVERRIYSVMKRKGYVHRTIR